MGILVCLYELMCGVYLGRCVWLLQMDVDVDSVACVCELNLFFYI